MTATDTLRKLAALWREMTPSPWRAEWNGSGHNIKVGKDWMIANFDTQYIAEGVPMISQAEVDSNGRGIAAMHNALTAEVLEQLVTCLQMMEMMIKAADWAIGFAPDCSRKGAELTRIHHAKTTLAALETAMKGEG